MYYTKDCKNCTKKFQSKRSDSEYCSSSCRSLYRRKSIDGHEDFVSDLKKQLLEIEKKLDFVIQKMNETTVGKHPESAPLKTTDKVTRSLLNKFAYSGLGSSHPSTTISISLAFMVFEAILSL